ncbi:conserved hypothetical protein [Pseudorhizobium banfieldiae]|uniref:Uncharacterized protein n=1 Tax=Pseudorhizobium banfieldiae TaxID=1125847 RepID=L0NB43_9HYPH|nr:DUF6634 family protein [Pseudorhizobium banfieldiae]CAD6600575.1 hypothetical protein RNT25_00773 [arsenite-oxidising bacterium NT-25]CCF18094.1 conserved hypothetical protein [Pseudorhizobium banfieldiae]
MIIYGDGQREIRQLERMIEKLQALLDDLVAIGEGDLPGQDRLEDAPLIDNWHLSTREIVCLRGEISGHPRLGYAPHGITSDLWLLAPQRGFARTISRYYRLGSRTEGFDG